MGYFEAHYEVAENNLGDDVRGIFIITALNQRYQFVTWGIFHQVRAFIVAE